MAFLLLRLLPMRHAIHTASAGLAYSLKAFVINSVLRISQEYIKNVGVIPEAREFLESERDKKHGALILDPLGRVLADGTGHEADPVVRRPRPDGCAHRQADSRRSRPLQPAGDLCSPVRS